MEGIYIAAILATFLSLTVLGAIILWKSPREEWLFIAIIFLLLLPFSPLVFNFMRLPFDGWLAGSLGKTSRVYEFLTTLYAPITEEPAKLWILLLPWIRKRIESKNAVRVALTIGLGFGIGEMWLLAVMFAQNPQIASLHWYLLGGYMQERFMVCVMHAAFTAVALRQLRRRFVLGIMGAMILHYGGNLPLFLAGIDLVSLGETAWQILLALWVQFYFIVMVGLLAYFQFGGLGRLGFHLSGRAQCPECGRIYERPLFAVSGLTRRYEKCPFCSRWHWTRGLKGRETKRMDVQEKNGDAS